MIAIVHSIYSQSVHAPASHARLMDNEAERYCTFVFFQIFKIFFRGICSKIDHSNKLTSLPLSNNAW